jgi:hypothetical protein
VPKIWTRPGRFWGISQERARSCCNVTSRQQRLGRRIGKIAQRREITTATGIDGSNANEGGQLGRRLIVAVANAARTPTMTEESGLEMS